MICVCSVKTNLLNSKQRQISHADVNLSVRSKVNGQSYEKFREKQGRILRTWVFAVGGRTHRAVLERDTLDLWLDGELLELEVGV